MRCELIAEADVKTLCAKAREILAEEGNVQVIDSPVTVSSFCTPHLFSNIPDLRRHPRSILRPDGAIQSGRSGAEHQLLVSRRLCRSRLLLGRDVPAAARPQSPLPRQNDADTRKSRESTDHTSVRILRRMPAKVRQCVRLETLYRGVRLSGAGRRHRRKGVLCARRIVAIHQYYGSDSGY